MSQTQITQSKQSYLKSLFFGLLSCLVVLEILLRVFPFARLRLEPQHFYRSNAILGWELTPNTTSFFHTTEYRTQVKINSNGFRDKEYAPEHPGVFRVFGLGGSFTFGYGVESEQTYLKLLEKKVNQKTPKILPIEVINMGVSSYSFYQNFLLFKEKGLQNHPDLVLLSFIITDPVSSIQAEYAVYDGFLLKAESLKSLFLKEKLFLYQHIKTLHFFSKVLDRLIQYFEESTMKYHRKDILLKQEHYEKGLRFIAKHLREMQRLCQEKNIRLAVLFIPHRSQIHGNKFKAGSYSEYFNFDQKLAELCKKEKIPYIDLLPALTQEAAKGKMLYFNIDGHWNALGHDEASRIIYDQLKAKNLLPEGTVSQSLSPS